jgi:hypothetical protein
MTHHPFVANIPALAQTKTQYRQIKEGMKSAVSPDNLLTLFAFFNCSHGWLLQIFRRNLFSTSELRRKRETQNFQEIFFLLRLLNSSC